MARIILNDEGFTKKMEAVVDGALPENTPVTMRNLIVTKFRFKLDESPVGMVKYKSQEPNIKGPYESLYIADQGLVDLYIQQEDLLNKPIIGEHGHKKPAPPITPARVNEMRDYIASSDEEMANAARSASKHISKELKDPTMLRLFKAANGYDYAPPAITVKEDVIAVEPANNYKAPAQAKTYPHTPAPISPAEENIRKKFMAAKHSENPPHVSATSLSRRQPFNIAHEEGGFHREEGGFHKPSGNRSK